MARRTRRMVPRNRRIFELDATLRRKHARERPSIGRSEIGELCFHRRLTSGTTSSGNRLMGAFLVNVHVRNEDHGSLMEALRELPVDRGWITPAKNGWASVYEERASTQDDAWIRELGGSLSGKLDARTVAFLVHDSDFLCYWLFDRGELVDEFNSCPDYFDDDGGDRSVSTAVGRPDLLLPFCRPGTRLRDIERILAQDPTFAESQLEELAP